MFEDRYITLAYGNGGRLMRELIEQVFARHFANPLLDTNVDAAGIALPPGDPIVTTDGFIVRPLEFPGGDIGSLAIHGTVNDLAVSGGEPLFLTVNAFIEEGMTFEQLDRVTASAGRAARECGVRIVAGDVKVLARGEGGGLYLATTGIGVRRPNLHLRLDQIRLGDVVLVSGPVGDHGAAVLLAREQFGLSGDLKSDSASVAPLTRALVDLPGLRFMRDPTRGGLATVANDIARGTDASVSLIEQKIPVHDQVRMVCEMLGYDPYYLACEGRVVAVVDPQAADAALCAWKAIPAGCDAAVIGHVARGRSRVILETNVGGERILDELEDDPLPRIC